ncbi:MAG: pyridoxamine 5'-phosphate oxidase family protein [Candidatus Margulisbacteria bacterium]|nr:pyridoxamine 5'-phosphate oxidase family protein [Candidatus Margulisiibacteriota bacterium]
MTKDLHKVALSIIEKSGKAFIGSVDSDGYPNIKAMLKPREQNGIKDFYFTTNTSSMRVTQFRANPKASLYFYDGRFFRGVMLIGTMNVLTDQATKDHIWRDGDTMYYQLGVSDPDYCVLKFTAIKGRIYQNFHSDDFTV